MRKVNFLSTLFAATALTMGVTSCSNDDNQEIIGNEETRTVMINIVDPNAKGTRAEGPTVADGTTISFTGGTIFFTTAAGIIQGVETITAAVGTAQTVAGVPNIATHVHVVGNVPTGASLPGMGANFGTWCSTAGNLISVNTQMNAAGSVAAVSAYGTAALAASSIPGIDMEATVTLNPLTARIELHKFTAGGTITGYQVDGIFINNYYSQSGLDGKSATTNVVSNTETNSSAPVVYVGGSAAYPTTDARITYDYAASGIGVATGLSFAPAAGNVWAYNMFAPTDNPALASGNHNFPHIELRFSNFTGFTPAQPIQWVTISGFKKESNPGVSGFDTDVELKAGEVYKIVDFTFDENDLVIAPDITKITANVTVSLATWKEVNVEPVH